MYVKAATGCTRVSVRVYGAILYLERGDWRSVPFRVPSFATEATCVGLKRQMAAYQRLDREHS